MITIIIRNWRKAALLLAAARYGSPHQRLRRRGRQFGC